VDQIPAIDGYITGITSSTDFAVNGAHVVCVAKTHYHVDGGRMQTQWTSGPYIGQPVKVFGKKGHTSHTVTAKEILPQYEEAPTKEGFGVIDRVLSPNTPQRNQIVVRADGSLVGSSPKSLRTMRGDGIFGASFGITKESCSRSFAKVASERLSPAEPLRREGQAPILYDQTPRCGSCLGFSRPFHCS
jgi:hypothetical protein